VTPAPERPDLQTRHRDARPWDGVPYVPSAPAPERPDLAAIAAGTHQPAVDDFGNQYLAPVTDAGLDVERLRQAIYAISVRYDWEHTTDREDRTEEIVAEYAALSRQKETA
jgi:hypothetical protein